MSMIPASESSEDDVRDLVEVLKPYLSGMSVYEINALITHLRDDTREQFEQWVADSTSSKLHVFYDVVKDAHLRDWWKGEK